MTKQAFIIYLVDIMIPDLKDKDPEAAMDFEVAVVFMEDPTLEEYTHPEWLK